MNDIPRTCIRLQAAGKLFPNFTKLELRFDLLLKGYIGNLSFANSLIA